MARTAAASSSGDAARLRFERIFEAYHRRILAYTLRRSSTVADAEDAAAETFVVAWRRLERVPPEDALPWLYAVARRALANQRRTQLRGSRLVEKLRLRAFPEIGPSAGEHGPAIEALARLSFDD